MKLGLARLFSLLFFLQVIMPPALSDEHTGSPLEDIQPPELFFDAGNNEIESGMKTFTAIVTDNVGVASVTLFFKSENDMIFTPLIMEQSDTDPGVYTREVSIDHIIDKKVEIYIRADDISGNSIFQGQKFSPLVFSVIPATGEKVMQPVTQLPVEEEESLSTLTWILIGIGVLALAGSSGGGGSDGGDGSVGTITITGDVPD